MTRVLYCVKYTRLKRAGQSENPAFPGLIIISMSVVFYATKVGSVRYRSPIAER